MTALRPAFSCGLMLIVPLSLVAAAQQPAASDVDKVLQQGQEEICSFEKAGGKKDDPNHPIEKWVQALWAFREKSPRAPDAAKATSEAVHLLIHADRFQNAYARVDQLASDDPAWAGLPQILFEAASIQKDFAYFFRKLDSVLPNAPDPKVRAAIQLALGRGWRAQHDDAKAKAAFEAAIASARDSDSARQAERELYELLHLGSGQPAPQFSAASISGSRVSLADYRGKPVLLVFWATH